MTLFQLLLTLSGILLVILLYCWSKYNQFIIARNQLKTDYSDINVQLKRRVTMVTDLETLVKGYAKHEEDTFENVTKARSAVETSSSAPEAAAADTILTNASRSLYLVSEAYPELKANQSFTQLMSDIKESENVIAGHREEYNRSVQQFNNRIQVFPGMMVAAVFGFKPGELFQES